MNTSTVLLIIVTILMVAYIIFLLTGARLRTIRGKHACVRLLPGVTYLAIKHRSTLDDVHPTDVFSWSTHPFVLSWLNHGGLNIYLVSQASNDKPDLWHPNKGYYENITYNLYSDSTLYAHEGSHPVDIYLTNPKGFRVEVKLMPQFIIFIWILLIVTLMFAIVLPHLFAI